MTNEEKQLLLKDLCARLSYGVKILDIPANVVGDLFLVSTTDIVEYEPTDEANDDNGRQTLYNIKPYLRQMSSMTEEEKDEYDRLVMCNASWVVDDWLLAHRFDFRRLIKKGLALEAPEGMYV